MKKFHEAYNVEGECWIKVRKDNNDLSIDGQDFNSRKLSYEIYKGEAPTGYLYTTCGNTLCINPEHLTNIRPTPAQDLLSKYSLDIEIAYLCGASAKDLSEEFGIYKPYVEKFVKPLIRPNAVERVDIVAEILKDYQHLKKNLLNLENGIKSLRGILGFKWCAGCKTWKSLDCFGAKNATLSAMPRCKDCTNKRVRDYMNSSPGRYHDKRVRYREANPEKYREERRKMNQRSRLANPERTQAKKARRRARKRGAKGQYTGQEVKNLLKDYNRCCYYCYKPLVKTMLGTQEQKRGYHLDHYIPLAKGGNNNIGNIVISCPVCNVNKRDLMPWVFKPGEGVSPKKPEIWKALQTKQG